MSKEELIKDLTTEITKKELIHRIAEAIATDRVENVEAKLKNLPNTIILKEEYHHPKTPQCNGCPHIEGRYVHPEKTQCILKIPEHPPLSHDHKGDTLHPTQINPVNCLLRTVTRVREAADVDDASIGDDKLLVYKTASKKHEYEAKSSTYSDAEAVAAVEAEPTLDLTGVIPDSAYPNAVLKDGSRAMTGNLDMGSHRINLEDNVDLAQIHGHFLVSYFHGSSAIADWLGRDFYWTRYLRGASTPTSVYIVTSNASTKHVEFQAYDTAYRTVMDMYNGLVDIPRAGDIISAGNNAQDIGDFYHRFATGYINSVIASSLQANDFSQAGAGLFKLFVYSNATRGVAGMAGRVIYNSSDAGLNIDDGTNWRDTNGNIT